MEILTLTDNIPELSCTASVGGSTHNTPCVKFGSMVLSQHLDIAENIYLEKTELDNRIQTKFCEKSWNIYFFVVI